MMHCTIYTLNEGFEPTHTKCYCDHSMEALMIRRIINHIMQPSSGFAFLLKTSHPGETTL